MDAPTVIQGKLVDARNVASHKCVRLYIDIPAELGASVVKMFGWPTQVEPVDVAVARLDIGAIKPVVEAPKERRKFADLSPAQQAALTCKEPRFWAWIREERGEDGCDSEGDAADYVREFCNVQSRSELNLHTGGATRWQFLCSAYHAWLAAE
jgi:hypothetical protein